ncbi:MAG: hypothetical protein R3C99_12380 [Pirellulaceae bacterium]
MTRITNGELVLGKIAASLLNVLAMLLAALPLFMAITLFGGVSFDQILRVFWSRSPRFVAAGCLGATVGFAREDVSDAGHCRWRRCSGSACGKPWRRSIRQPVRRAITSAWAARFSPVRAVWEAMQHDSE